MNIFMVHIKEGTSNKTVKEKIKLYFPTEQIANEFVINYNRIYSESFRSWIHHATYIGEYNIHNPLQFIRHKYKGDLVEMPKDWSFNYEIPS